MWVIRLETHCDLQVGGRASWHLQFTATTGRGTAMFTRLRRGTAWCDEGKLGGSLGFCRPKKRWPSISRGIHSHRIHVCMPYMVTFTINIPPMLAYIYQHHGSVMGLLWPVTVTALFFNPTPETVHGWASPGISSQTTCRSSWDQNWGYLR